MNALKFISKRPNITINKYGWNYLLLLPGAIYFLVFCYAPMYGLIIAFKDFNIVKGVAASPWAGWKYFEQLFTDPMFIRAFRNTLIISFFKIIITFPFPIVMALMLNEMPGIKLKKAIQTAIYIPYFISWAVIGGIVYALASPATGLLPVISNLLGVESVNIMMKSEWFRPLLILSAMWKTAGWNTIVFLASLTAINTELYEAAALDGANRMQRVWHVSLPGIRSIVAIMFLLRIGQTMNAGFAQVMSMLNPIVQEVGEIIETYIFKVGIMDQRYSFTTAVGLVNSIIVLVLVLATNIIARKSGEEGLW